ncbi:4'-phosphopantetheinyl transferase [uncultured Mameliella sp.]|uniref:4'-phosphopantetheinyl transferase family protein n=1 Tax=uncultured Mameliella sp. TaxID=1447087 RepID=UPI0026399751|nr:4'-phosphopantetheinyl transferase superfamily protein [uncultured Mameliella sp.]
MTAAQLERLVRQIGPLRGLGWGVAVPGEGDLFPAEVAAIARARPARRAEFAAGRLAARRAMAQLDVPTAAIPMGADRAPVWPKGLVGSISHAEGLCLAVVAGAKDYRSLGIDIEGDGPLAEDLIPEICRPEEIALLPKAFRAAEAKRLFSAKEAVYKAHYPLAGQVFGFHGLQVDLAQGRARFTDHPEVASIPPESRADLPIRQVFGGGVILSLCAIPAGITAQ